VGRVRLDQEGASPLVLGDEFTIGRDDANTLALPDDAALSRRHATISATADGYFLSDAGSRNGTRLERDGASQRVDRNVALRTGDVIVLGDTRLIMEDATRDETGTRILDPQLTNVPGATRVGRVLPGVPPGEDPSQRQPAQPGAADTGTQEEAPRHRPSLFRRLLRRGG
jgi:pSer/pThr/pTyr-binding forkhead associated (FHA) protein